jgi:hypothetical protein
MEAGPPATPRDPAYNGIYVPSGTGVFVFALSAQGNVAPIRTLSGPSTKLRLPVALAVDSLGELFVANEDMFGSTSVQAYPRLASGDVAPLRTLAAPGGFGINGITGLAIGPSDELWIAEYNAFHFPANSSSSDYTIVSGPNLVSVAVSSAGDITLATSTGTLETYAAGDAGPQTPIRTLATGKVIRAIAIADQTIFVLDSTGTIDEFSVTSTGNAAPAATLMGPTTPLQTAHAIAIDSTLVPPTLYVAADDATTGFIYALPLVGNAPAYTAGSTTSLHGPLTTLRSAGSVFVVHY